MNVTWLIEERIAIYYVSLELAHPLLGRLFVGLLGCLVVGYHHRDAIVSEAIHLMLPPTPLNKLYEQFRSEVSFYTRIVSCFILTVANCANWRSFSIE